MFWENELDVTCAPGAVFNSVLDKCENVVPLVETAKQGDAVVLTSPSVSIPTKDKVLNTIKNYPMVMIAPIALILAGYYAYEMTRR